MAETHAETVKGLDALDDFRTVRGIVALNDIAQWHWACATFKAKAVGAKAVEDGVAGVDWPSWRRGLEYLALYHRCERRFSGIVSPTCLTRLLELALSRMILNQPETAAGLLRKTQGYLVKVAGRAAHIGRLPPGDLGVIGLLYQQLMGYTPDQPVLRHDATLLSPDGLTRTLEARKRYAKPSINLLSGHSYKLIPLEMVWLNNLLPAADQWLGLTAMAQAMADTVMPDDPQLRHYDERLRAEGL